MNMEKVIREEVIIHWRRRRFQSRLLNYTVSLCITVGLYLAVAPFVFIAWNYTHSLPGHVYAVITLLTPRRGNVAAFQPPANPYYPHQMRFLKLLMGDAGDRITHRGRMVYLNGMAVGVAQTRDSREGRQLAMIADGVIPAGYHFMWTPHVRSYDSRYAEIGLISDAQIVGRAFLLF